jgi:hypothetical protein
MADYSTYNNFELLKVITKLEKESQTTCKKIIYLNKIFKKNGYTLKINNES